MGGHNTVKMADLVSCFSDLGLSQVKTYINSGNVIFKAPESNELTLESTLEITLNEKYPFEIPVFLRTFEQLRSNLSDTSHTLEINPEHALSLIFVRGGNADRSALDALVLDPMVESIHRLDDAFLWTLKPGYRDQSLVSKASLGSRGKHLTIRNLTTVQKVFDLMVKTKAAA